MKIVIGVMMVMTAVPIVVYGTLLAFNVYLGHSFDQNVDLMIAMYKHTIYFLLHLNNFAFPAFNFNLFKLRLNLDFLFRMVWQWRFTLPTDLLAVAKKCVACLRLLVSFPFI